MKLRDTIAAERRQRERKRKATVRPRIEQWDENKTPWRPELYLNAPTYKVDRLFDVELTDAEGDGPYLLSPSAGFAYRNRILPGGQPLLLFPDGVVSWNGPVIIPILSDTNLRSDTGERMTGYSEKHRAKSGMVWMSLTPAEMISQRPGLRRAVGKVVVGGLGLGWFLRKVCEKPEVESVIVVEKSRELLDWYGYEQCQRQRKVTDVICDDVYRHIGKHSDAVYLLDIWPTYRAIGVDAHFWELKQQLGDRLWGWGE